MFRIHIVGLLIFVIHVSPSMEINVYVNKDFRWTEVDGVDAYELLSYAFFIFIKLVLDVCIATIKLFIILPGHDLPHAFSQSQWH